MKIITIINSRKKIVHFSFYFNSKIIRIFCPNMYSSSIGRKKKKKPHGVTELNGIK
jgi:hypothetical protein